MQLYPSQKMCNFREEKLPLATNFQEGGVEPEGNSKWQSLELISLQIISSSRLSYLFIFGILVQASGIGMHNTYDYTSI